MTKKCCYFVRNIPAGVALDNAKVGESDLLFGEVGDSPLGTIESMLSQSYRPMLDSYDNWGWWRFVFVDYTVRLRFSFFFLIQSTRSRIPQGFAVRSRQLSTVGFRWLGRAMSVRMKSGLNENMLSSTTHSHS